MNVFDAPVEPVEVVGLYRQLPLPPRRVSHAGRKPGPPGERRRISVKVWLTEAEYAAVNHLNMSEVGRKALLAAANKTGDRKC